MPSDRKKPSNKPDVKSRETKKKSKPIEPEVDEGKEYDSPFPLPDAEAEKSKARKVPGDPPPSDYM